MKAIHKILVIGLALCAFTACDEDAFLKEEPFSIYSTENALVTESDYQAMVNHLYYQIKRSLLNVNTQDVTIAFRSCNDYGYYSSDVAFTNHVPAPKGNNDIVNFLTPSNTKVHKAFPYVWDLICNANVVISRIDGANFAEAKKNVMKGEALFARSWAYTFLAHVYGGMPILDKEVTTPSREYTRASREDTYKFALEGFKTAAGLLPDVDKAGDGKANKQICKHFMAEVNICLKNYADAISCANEVINYPGCSLMTERFGKLQDKPGDVYWDLFRNGNYNYSCGNHEGLYVYQADYGNSASVYDNSGENDYFVREYNCRYMKMSVVLAPGAKAVSPFTSYAVTGLCGRAYGYNHPTDHFMYEIWEGMDGDIRNSEYNIMRDVRCNNKTSTETYGKWFIADGVYDAAVANGYEPKSMYWWPFITKVANTVYDWPENEKVQPIVTDEFYGVRASEQNGKGLGRDHSHKDSYMARLAETYLLRAEANVLSGNAAAAAADINVLRDRAHAPKVNGTVDLDYVLDERLRELYTEENRTITLLRMGKYVERTKKYNDVTIGLAEHNNLFPIPYDVIENNVLAEFTQNPGY